MGGKIVTMRFHFFLVNLFCNYQRFAPRTICTYFLYLPLLFFKTYCQSLASIILNYRWVVGSCPRSQSGFICESWIFKNISKLNIFKTDIKRICNYCFSHNNKSFIFYHIEGFSWQKAEVVRRARPQQTGSSRPADTTRTGVIRSQGEISRETQLRVNQACKLSCGHILPAS